LMYDLSKENPMAHESLTDAAIATLIDMQKEPISTLPPKPKDKGSHTEINYHLKAVDGDEKFSLLIRQNNRVVRDFSCILQWHSPEGDLILLRCNGSSHPHGKIRFKCHIHRTTEGALRRGWKPESHADATEDYSLLEGAKYTIVRLANIRGIPAQPVAPSLFP